MERYTKIRNIGKGNMGAAILVRGPENGIYVMKLVDISKMDRREKQQAMNEAKLLSQMRHPNVVSYVESFLTRRGDQLCIVMEYAEGGDMSAKVKSRRGKPFPEEMVLDWLIQLCLGLKHIHSKKMLHRDLKSQNIFLTSSGLCKIGDFGIARTLANTFDVAQTFVGTPYYLSPELVQEKPYNFSSDMWALGVVLYEMMALRHPFNANDMKGLMQKILRCVYDPPPSSYSAGLRDIVGKLIVREPRKRAKVSDLLELPIIKNRLRQWTDGSATGLPSSYLEALIRVADIDGTISTLSTDTDAEEEVAAKERAVARDNLAFAREREKAREEIRRQFADIAGPGGGGLAPIKQAPAIAAIAKAQPHHLAPIPSSALATPIATPPNANPFANPNQPRGGSRPSLVGPPSRQGLAEISPKMPPVRKEVASLPQIAPVLPPLMPMNYARKEPATGPPLKALPRGLQPLPDVNNKWERASDMPSDRERIVRERLALLRAQNGVDYGLGNKADYGGGDRAGFYEKPAYAANNGGAGEDGKSYLKPIPPPRSGSDAASIAYNQYWEARRQAELNRLRNAHRNVFDGYRDRDNNRAANGGGGGGNRGREPPPPFRF